MSPHAVETRGLVKRFGATTAVDGVDLVVPHGAVYGLRSLPMARSVVLIGRTAFDLVRNILTFFVMLGIAFVIGFRFEGSLLGAAMATLLLLLFSYSLSWVPSLMGSRSSRSTSA